MTVSEFLTHLDACPEAVTWSKTLQRSDDLWYRCPHIEWMLWMFQQLDYRNEPKLRIFAGACVRRHWDQLVDERSRRAVEIAEQYAVNTSNTEQLRFARQAARAAMDDVSMAPNWSALLASAASAAYQTTRASAVEAARHCTLHCQRASGLASTTEEASGEEIWQVTTLRDLLRNDLPHIADLVYDKMRYLES